MKMFMTNCGGEFCYAVRAASARSATGWARRRHGTIIGQITSQPASLEDLNDHLEAGAVFFDADQNAIIPKTEAQALVGRS